MNVQIPEKTELEVPGAEADTGVEVAGEGNVELLLVAVTSPLLSLAVPRLLLDTRCSLASIQHVSATCRRVPASSGLKDCNLKQTS